MSAARQIESPLHSRDEFYELERTSSVRHEFYGGHIVAMAGGSPRHGRIIGETTRILGNALQGRSCFAVPSDQMVRIENADMDAYPDVVVYCEDAEFDSRFERTLLEPLVLVEVLSPSTQNIDLAAKRWNYFQSPSPTDYLIFWQDKIRLDQFVRAANPGDEPQVEEMCLNSRHAVSAQRHFVCVGHPHASHHSTSGSRRHRLPVFRGSGRFALAGWV